MAKSRCDESFWDTGHALARLLGLRAVFLAANIKELVTNAKLPMSHMTANKYLQIARTFTRDVAVNHGIEKCYALIAYSKVVGRPGEAASILAANEQIRGGGWLSAQSASAAQILRAIHALKKAARDSKVPTESRAAYERAADTCEKFFRALGVANANAHVIKQDGRMVMQLTMSLEVAESLTQRVPRAFARLGPKLAKTQPELFEPLRAAGWKPSARTG